VPWNQGLHFWHRVLGFQEGMSPPLPVRCSSQVPTAEFPPNCLNLAFFFSYWLCPLSGQAKYIFFACWQKLKLSQLAYTSSLIQSSE
jgi:hypothetical protein